MSRKSLNEKREHDRWVKRENARIRKLKEQRAKAELLAWVKEVNKLNERLGVQV